MPGPFYIDREQYGIPLDLEYPFGLPEQLPRSVSSPALQNALLVCAGEARLYGFSVYSNKATAQFVQLFDAAAVPADTAVPVLVLTVAGTSNLGAAWGTEGRWMNSGIVICNSSTAATKTIASADCFFDVQYVPQVL